MSEQRTIGRLSAQLTSWLGRLALLTALITTAIGLCTGCLRGSLLRQATTPSYKPTNVYQEEAHLPAEIKRVAILPLTSLGDDTGTDFGRESLGPILLNELGRSRLFELVIVSPEELRLITGRNAWTGEEKLPTSFFDKLREKLAVDAVMFCRLTQYRAYEPLTVGWRLKLLDAIEPHILWAVDEVFDAKVPEVAAAARRFVGQRPDSSSSSLQDAQTAMVSPRRFGQYTVHAIVQTLPGRKEEPR